jgi:hypothetical protein
MPLLSLFVPAFPPLILVFFLSPRQFRNANGQSSTAEIRLKMQRTMQRHAAVFRTQSLLDEGVKKLDEVYQEFERDIKVTDRSLVWFVFFLFPFFSSVFFFSS